MSKKIYHRAEMLRPIIRPALLISAVVALGVGSPATSLAAKKKPTPRPTVKAAAHPSPKPTPKPSSDIAPATPAPQGTSVSSSGATASKGAVPLSTGNLEQDFKNLPTNVNSDTLVLHSNDRVFIYKGHVVVSQGDMTLTSNTLEGTYNEQNQIQRMVAKGDVVIVKQEIKATSQQALYEAPTATITLIDNPQLEQKESVLTADRIKIFLNENRSQAEGNVRVTLVNAKDAMHPESIGLKKPTAAPTAIVTPQFVTTIVPKARTTATPTVLSTVNGAATVTAVPDKTVRPVPMATKASK